MKFLIVLIMAPAIASAGDLLHRYSINNISLASAIDRPLRNMFWISRVDVEPTSNEFFSNSSGAVIANVRKTVTSYYDPDITYDLSNFYKKTNNRVRFISNFVLDSPNTFYSIGIDTGVSSEKLKVNKSLFIGVSHVFHLNMNSYFSINGGSWLGGSIKETPCYDSYNREYWCQNLTSWADYKPSYPKNLSYIDFRFIHRF